MAAFGAQATGTNELVLIGEGTLPIVISAPHGGSLAVPGVAARTNAAASNFKTLRDTGTDVVAEKIAAQLEATMGGRPFVVIARFDRKFIDANRSAADAYESEKAKPVYDVYHRALSNACRSVLAKWGCGILLDVHGQAASSNAIFRGTADGRTVHGLVKRAGSAAMSGPQSILGQMAARGYEIIPAIGDTAKEDARFNGGFIVRSHGSGRTDGLDAMQLELGRNLRNKQNMDRVASDLSASIAAFARAYLTNAPPATPAIRTP